MNSMPIVKLSRGNNHSPDDKYVTITELCALFGVVKGSKDSEPMLERKYGLKPVGVHKYGNMYHPVYSREEAMKVYEAIRKPVILPPPPPAPMPAPAPMTEATPATVDIQPVLAAIAEVERRILDKMVKENNTVIDTLAEIEGKMGEFAKHMGAFLKHLQDQAAKK